VLRQLGEGGMGVVYEAEELAGGQRLAIKVIKHGYVDETYRLKREFRALADLSHPNLIDVYDLGGEGHALFVTMELVEGESFTRHCRGDLEVGELGDERRIRAALLQLVSGLAALHEAGLVHRDVKPSNVLVTDAGRVVLLDLGLVATQATTDSLAGRIVGSVEYMAPEQANAETITPAADWYAVGALLFEALTGKPPFAGSIIECLLAKQQHPAPPPRAVVPTVSEDLDDLCTVLLAREPSRRPSLPQLLMRLGAAPAVASAPSVSITQLVPFCGRVAELARLDKVAGRAREGRHAVAYVRGASGIGKSALIDRFVETVFLAEQPFLVLRGRCYERETVPYKAMDAVIDELSRFWSQLPDQDATPLLHEHAPLLPRLFPVLGRVPAVVAAPTGAWVSDPQEMRTRAFAALRHVFIELARRQPVLMVLDDLQWIDEDSIILLADLLRSPYPAGIMLLLASRDESDRSRRARTESEQTRPGEHQEIERLLRDLPAHELIELGPLPRLEAQRLAASMLGDGLTEHVDAVVGEAGGSPFFLSELSRYLQDSPARERASIDDVLRARISRLPERGAALLELLSIAGDPVSPRVMQSSLGLSPEEVARLVRYLRASLIVRSPGGVNDAVEPYHDRLREHMRESLSPERRQHLHRDLAMALERWSEGSAEQRARHWFGAGDRERATRYAREAADHAVSTLDFARAARLYRLALDIGAFEQAERRHITTQLGMALSSAGRAAEGAEMLLEAAVGADPVTALELRLRSAEA
ncbi:MAG TPA: protein kinase, partial [Kofleriaceae bacterium]|nr:protein kinase [Kofleriaceae bacterium]